MQRMSIASARPQVSMRAARMPAQQIFRGPTAALRPWITNAFLLLLGAALIALSLQLVREHSHFQIGFSGVSGWSATVYIAACAIVLTQPTNRWTLPLIFTVAVACRAIALVPPPFLSSDIYRYVWDGVVQHAGISPYRYVPGDAALTFLRAPHHDVFDSINRRDFAHTIYPPLAQMIFFLVTWIAPTVRAMKIAMVLFEGITVWALMHLLREMGRHPEQILLYAWCPMLVWEIAGAGHVDSAAIAFIALALLARMRRQPVLTGLWLGIAVMIKFYPLVLLPDLWWRGDGKGGAWKIPATLAAVICFGYAVYASVGKMVFGYAPGYMEEEGLTSGARYFLFALVRRLPGMHAMPILIFYLVCGIIFTGLALWAWKTSTPAASPRSAFLPVSFAFAVALMLLFSPHYAWYVIWLVPFFTLLPNLPILVYLMGFFYGFTTALAVPGPRMFRLNEWLYAATAAAFCIWIGIRRSPLHRSSSITEDQPPHERHASHSAH